MHETFIKGFMHETFEAKKIENAKEITCFLYRGPVRSSAADPYTRYPAKSGAHPRSLALRSFSSAKAPVPFTGKVRLTARSAPRAYAGPLWGRGPIYPHRVTGRGPCAGGRPGRRAKHSREHTPPTLAIVCSIVKYSIEYIVYSIVFGIIYSI